MRIEFHQLDLRYEALRRRNPRKERQLVASLAESGQLLPVVVVALDGQSDRYVLIDGYKRVRALGRLGEDKVRATHWNLDEAEALLLERVMRSAEPDGALEQGWLLCELRDRFDLTHLELARRFDRSQSWVSRRLALVGELPTEVQEHVRSGAIPAHAAMKYLAPMARATLESCERLASAIAPARLGTRQIGQLYAAWSCGSEATRDRLIADPLLYLRARQEALGPDPGCKSPGRLLMDDLGALGDIARRAHRRLREAGTKGLIPPEREEAMGYAVQARADVEVFFRRWDQEVSHARSEHPGNDPTVA